MFILNLHLLSVISFCFSNLNINIPRYLIMILRIYFMFWVGFSCKEDVKDLKCVELRIICLLFAALCDVT